MKLHQSLLRLVTVVSSVLLVGGFICYRDSAGSWLMGRSAEPTVDVATGEPMSPTLMSGSKSLAPLTHISPSPAVEQPPAVPQQQRTLMSSSKSRVLIIPPPVNQSAAQQPAAPQQQVRP